MDMNEARELVGDEQLWPLVRDRFLESGEFKVYPRGDLRRIELLPPDWREAIGRWLDALTKLDEWKTKLGGEEVRAIQRDYPGVYPEVFRYAPYFARFGKENLKDNEEAVKLLLQLKFPEAYELCCS